MELLVKPEMLTSYILCMYTDLRLATLKAVSMFCCTMIQHWINAESYPVAQLCVNTASCQGYPNYRWDLIRYVKGWTPDSGKQPKRKHTVDYNCSRLCYYVAISCNFLPTFRGNLSVLSFLDRFWILDPVWFFAIEDETSKLSHNVGKKLRVNYSLRDNQ
jgi:hypothetical protein